MSLSDKELKEIAYLARINIDENSFPSLKGELDDILGLFEKLNSANTLVQSGLFLVPKVIEGEN